MHRKLPQTPRNIYEDLFEHFDDGDNREDHGRVAFDPRAGEEEN